MLGYLVPCAGGQPIPLLKPKLLVGRQGSCDVPLRFATVSSRHCELELQEGYWFVRDLGSTNGTQVNGTPCDSARLMPNDVLTVASYRYTVVYTPSPSPSSPRPAAQRPAPAPQAPAARAPQPHAGIPLLGELVPCGGGETIPLRRERLVVGRNAECDIVVRNSAISGRHCELELREGRWHVRDLGSRHGIRVDGKACQSAQLEPGSMLWIAGQRYQVEYRAPGGAGPPRRSLFNQSLLEAAGLSKLPPDRPEPPGEDDQRKRYTLDDSE